MVNRVGVIDLGSNTFHLLIVDFFSNNSFQQVKKVRSFVGLAEDGIENLSQKAMDKGLEALSTFKSILKNHNVSRVKVTGTAALRSANNKNTFINNVKDRLGFDIEVIGGNREAELIFKGVSLLHPMSDNHIIMDIGGGSVEFIIVNKGKNVWSKSYNIGVGVLHSNFHKSDPIAKNEIADLIAFLYAELKELRALVSNLEIDSLIGASGSFEVVESMNGKVAPSEHISEVSLDDYWNVSTRVIEASYLERSEMKGLPSSRVKLIVVAMILIDMVIEMTSPKKILISPFALKEGLLSELGGWRN